MGDAVKAGLIVAMAILMAQGASIYFSPFQSCVRSIEKTVPASKHDQAADIAARWCARANGYSRSD